jgi:hypothetical protein
LCSSDMAFPLVSDSIRFALLNERSTEGVKLVA